MREAEAGLLCVTVRSSRRQQVLQKARKTEKKKDRCTEVATQGQGTLRHCATASQCSTKRGSNSRSLASGNGVISTLRKNSLTVPRKYQYGLALDHMTCALCPGAKAYDLLSSLGAGPDAIDRSVLRFFCKSKKSLTVAVSNVWRKSSGSVSSLLLFLVATSQLCFVKFVSFGGRRVLSTPSCEQREQATRV